MNITTTMSLRLIPWGGNIFAKPNHIPIIQKIPWRNLAFASNKRNVYKGPADLLVYTFTNLYNPALDVCHAGFEAFDLCRHGLVRVHHKHMLYYVKVHTELLHSIGQDQLRVCTHILPLVVLGTVCDVCVCSNEDNLGRPRLLAIDC